MLQPHQAVRGILEDHGAHHRAWVGQSCVGIKLGDQRVWICLVRDDTRVCGTREAEEAQAGHCEQDFSQ